MEPREIPEPGAFDDRRRLRWGLLVFVAVAAYFLMTEHRAHVVAVLPWLLLLACPFMHLFMHRGHRSHHHDDRPISSEKAAGDKEQEHQHGGHGCC